MRVLHFIKDLVCLIVDASRNPELYDDEATPITPRQRFAVTMLWACLAGTLACVIGATAYAVLSHMIR